MNFFRNFFALIMLFCLIATPVQSATQVSFNPHFIISDPELQDFRTWSRHDVQLFLDNKGSYLRNYQAPDVNGETKSAADIIYEAAERHQINPKFLLVTLQKEQSLITDDTPTQKQLDWATGYAVCDSCSMSDPKVMKYKGFGLQVDNAAGIMRWYYNNTDRSYVKKKDLPQFIDDQQVTPQSWATAFLYTYTPHIHGNKNFDRIWKAWFDQIYPEGTLLKTASSPEVWLVQNGQRRKFKNQAALVSRADPKMIVSVPEIELSNYEIGPEISFPNYSLLRANEITYLVDYDSIRPFASPEVVGKLGFNPQEIIDVAAADLVGLSIGTPITTDSSYPQGVIFQISDLNNTYYLLKDNVLHAVLDRAVVDINFKNLAIEKRQSKDLANYQLADLPIKFSDGTLIQTKDGSTVYVIEKGKKRRIADDETFVGLGYKRSNVVLVDLVTALNIPEGDPLFLNSSLASSHNKFLGDISGSVPDQFKSKLPGYLVAEFPSGRIIAGKNIDTERPIASLTKLLTAYETLQADFDKNAFTSFNADLHDAPTNVLKLRPGEKLKNIDIMNAMLVGSINNTAQMLATAASLSSEQMVARINTRLQEWGADNTVIRDLSGLNEGNKSTPRDLLKIFTKVANQPDIKPIIGKSNFSFSGVFSGKKIPHTVKQTNQLQTRKDRRYTILGSKTGYTEEAGAVMIMLIQTGKPGQTKTAITSSLKEGMQGSQVKSLQEALLAAGYFPKNVKINGFFGKTTLAALKKFQSAHKLEPVGFTGPSTRALLNDSNVSAKQYVVITMGNTDYAHRFDEPHRIAELTAAGTFTIANKK